MLFLSITLQSLVWGTQVLLIATGLYLVATASRIFHLSIGAIGVASAYGVYWGLSSGLPVLAALVLGIMVALGLSLLSLRLLEPFTERQEPLMGLLVSFALGIALESVIAIIFGSAGRMLDPGILPVLRIGRFYADLPAAVTVVIGVLIAAFIWAAVHLTSVGRLFRGIAENPALTTSLGVSRRSIRRAAFCSAGLVAGTIVTLAGWHTALTPGAGFHLVVAAFMALLIGGVSDLRGTIIASYLLALIPGFVIAFTNGLSENWRMVLVFLLAAILLAFRPRGLFTRTLRQA